MSTIRKGEVWIPGRSRDAARLLLQAAENLDLDPSVVRGMNGGYGVPEEVKAEAERLFEAGEFEETAETTIPWAPTDVATDTDDSDVSRVASDSKGGVSYVVSGGPKKPKRGGTKTVTPEQLEADRAAAKQKAEDEAKAEQERLDAEQKAEDERVAAEKAAAENPPPAGADQTPAAENVTGEKVDPGTQVTDETAGKVVDANGTEHTGEIPVADESAPVEEPAKNASKADWQAYAKTRPNFDAQDLDEDDGLSRNELAAKYGTPAE